ncbi:MAG: hypothetical protein AB1486_06575, partial [Planctomycetota bacterium]
MNAYKAGKYALSLFVSLLLGTAVTPLLAQGFVPQREQPWERETVELASSLAIQDDGRVKPLYTMASFTLLRLNGKRSCEIPAPEATPESVSPEATGESASPEATGESA